MITIPFPTTDADCVAIQSTTQIYVYTDGQRDTFVLFGDSWIKTASTTYNTIPSTTVCQTIEGIPYHTPETEVYFSALAFFTAIIIIAFAIYLFVFKWWRKT